MSWNYRVMRQRDPDGSFVFGIHEVYYDDGVANTWTERQSSPQGDTFKELTEDFASYQRAFERPVLAVEADGNELYEVGPMGNARLPTLVWRRYARIPGRKVGKSP